MKIVIACTGSGGHLTAGLAVADLLKGKNPAAKVFFLGSINKRARELTGRAGWPYRQVMARGLVSRNPFLLLYFGFSQFFSIIQSLWWLLRWRPNLLLATGGYAAAGVVMAGWLLRIPVVVHEQNIVPGKANRFIAPLAAKLLVSFRETAGYWLKYRCVCTGMPPRPFKHLAQAQARMELGLSADRLTVLVMGGSKGSQRINQLLLELLPCLRDFKEKVQFIHLTGSNDCPAVAAGYQRRGFVHYVKDFSFTMDINYSAADLVVSRAGSSSISEILSFGLPAIFIPYPYSADKHQLKNVCQLVEQGAAIVVTEQEINAERLVKEISDFIRQPERLKQMAFQSRALCQPDAGETIIKELFSL